MILVTGAGGKTGRAVVGALSGRGLAVRAAVRSDSQAQQMQVLGAASAVTVDLEDRRSLAQALRGSSAVYHIAPNMHPAEVEIGASLLDLALSAGVEKIVYHSVLRPQAEKMPHHWNKLRVEEMVFESGLDFTILQPAPYMQNILAYREQIIREGRFSVPYSPLSGISLLDLQDLGAVAATVLSDSRHHGAVYELVSTPPLTSSEIAVHLSALTRKAVVCEEESLEFWRARAERAGAGGYEVDTLVKMFSYYNSYGLPGNPFVLSALLGRSPTTLDSFLKREFSS